MVNRRKGRAFIGTSGWNYGDWKDDFYAGVPRKRWLAHYAQHFDAVEVNATFYHEARRSTFELWRESTPANFRFAIKGHRYITHVERLNAPAKSIERQREGASMLGDKLAAVLWQLPASLKCDLARLRRFAATLDSWREVRHAIEFRDESWFVEDIAEVMRESNLSVCQSDAADWPMWDAVTADTVYIRLHGHTITYASNYSDNSLRSWLRRAKKWLDEGRDVHVYFDNTAAGAAVRNALRMAELMRE
jgi:uncharacterized protein YecE (DUF72 family)